MKDESEKMNKSLAGLSGKVTGLESRLNAFDAKQEMEIAEVVA